MAENNLTVGKIHFGSYNKEFDLKRSAEALVSKLNSDKQQINKLRQLLSKAVECLESGESPRQEDLSEMKMLLEVSNGRFNKQGKGD